MKVTFYYIVSSLWMGLFLSAFTARKLPVSAAEKVKHLYFLHYTVRFLIDGQESHEGSWFFPRIDLGREHETQPSLIH